MFNVPQTTPEGEFLTGFSIPGYFGIFDSSYGGFVYGMPSAIVRYGFSNNSDIISIMLGTAIFSFGPPAVFVPYIGFSFGSEKFYIGSKSYFGVYQKKIIPIGNLFFGFSLKSKNYSIFPEISFIFTNLDNLDNNVKKLLVISYSINVINTR